MSVQAWMVGSDPFTCPSLNQHVYSLTHTHTCICTHTHFQPVPVRGRVMSSGGLPGTVSGCGAG